LLTLFLVEIRNIRRRRSLRFLSQRGFPRPKNALAHARGAHTHRAVERTTRASSRASTSSGRHGSKEVLVLSVDRQEAQVSSRIRTHPTLFRARVAPWRDAKSPSLRSGEPPGPRTRPRDRDRFGSTWSFARTARDERVFALVQGVGRASTTPQRHRSSLRGRDTPILRRGPICHGVSAVFAAAHPRRARRVPRSLADRTLRASLASQEFSRHPVRWPSGAS
jgi:hypothetical protein